MLIFDLTEPEMPDDDSNSIQEIFNWAGADGLPFEFRRVGRKYPNSNRPVLVTVADKLTRNLVIDKFRSLDEDSLGFVRVKKDINPVFRGEWRRLYELEHKTKLQNPESTVTFDKVKRRILCDGKIIDYWHP